jgi:hypothetical protein
VGVKGSEALRMWRHQIVTSLKPIIGMHYLIIISTGQTQCRIIITAIHHHVHMTTKRSTQFPIFIQAMKHGNELFFSATNRCTDATDMITASLSMIPLVMYSDGSINFYKHKDPIYLVNTDNK